MGFGKSHHPLRLSEMMLYYDGDDGMDDDEGRQQPYWDSKRRPQATAGVFGGAHYLRSSAVEIISSRSFLTY